MSFLKDIKNQSQASREIMFALSVVITVSLIGVVWFNSFQENIYVMLNPDKETEQKFFAGGADKFAYLYDKQKTDLPSLFSSIGQTGKDLKAAFLNVLNLKNNDIEISPSVSPQPQGESLNNRTYLLPLAGDKNKK